MMTRTKTLGALEQAARVTNLFSAGIVAGGQAFCLVAVIPALRDWPPRMSAQAHRDALTDRPESMLRPAAIVAAASGAAGLGLQALQGDDTRASRALTALGIAATVTNGIISARWEWPINREVKSWSNEAVPARYATMRKTWDQKHATRTAVSVVAALAFILGSLVRRPAR